MPRLVAERDAEKQKEFGSKQKEGGRVVDSGQTVEAHAVGPWASF